VINYRVETLYDHDTPYWLALGKVVYQKNMAMLDR
jgi:hypothetical protein